VNAGLTNSELVEAASGDLQAVRAMLSHIPDPEIPAVSLVDLGILREVRADEHDPLQLVVVLTPTYSGCPATDMIRRQVREALQASGFPNARIELQLAPAWTTDWITPEGREKLRAYGIAPPSGSSSLHDTTSQVIRLSPKPASDGPVCPRCASPRVEQLSAYGSTPCKSLYRCVSCREPFDYFKPY
jgi:ring-1,2-phenylacetyl-CoA epoxidase subunit PaaD